MVKGVDPLQSGIMTLPIILFFFVASIVSGILITTLGPYTPYMIVGSVITTVGSGLITTFTPSTDRVRWISYIALIGFGAGCGLEQPQIVAQTVLKEVDVPIGLSIMVLAQSLGAACFLSVNGNVLRGGLQRKLNHHVPTSVVRAVLSAGPTGFHSVVDEKWLPQVIMAYDVAIRQTFYVGVVMAGLSFCAACMVERRSVKVAKTEKAKK